MLALSYMLRVKHAQTPSMSQRTCMPDPSPSCICHSHPQMTTFSCRGGDTGFCFWQVHCSQLALLTVVYKMSVIQRMPCCVSQ